jgi:hypothetical protein
MYQRLHDQGLTAEPYYFSQQSVGRLATTLHMAIRDHHLALPDDEELIDELANVRLRETSPGVLRMDHDSDKHDDRAIALALAVHHVIAQPSQGHVFLETWKAEIAQGTDAAIEQHQRSKGRRQHANAVSSSVRARMCKHFWGPPSPTGSRQCLHCPAEQS